MAKLDQDTIDQIVSETLIDTEFDATLHDNNKTITVPTGEKWLICWVHAKFTNSGEAGSRLPQLIIQDASDNELLNLISLGTVDGAATVSQVNWMPGLTAQNTANQSCMNVSTPTNFIVQGGEKITVKDKNNVDANVSTGDSIELTIRYIKLL